MRIPLAIGLFVFLSLMLVGSMAQAAFHLWYIKEIYSNHDGSVQFIELFTTFSGQEFLAGQTLESDENSFDFTNSPSPTNNRHLLLGTPGYAALANAPMSGLAMPNYTFETNNFFDETGDTIVFAEFYDEKSFSPIPTDGVTSLNYTGPFSAATSAPNSPRNFVGTANGSLNLPPPPPPITGDYNGDDFVTAADYTKWRNNLGGDPSVFPAGSRGPGMLGPIALGDYTFWKLNYGNDYSSMGAGSGASTAVAVPEPATAAILSVSLLGIFSTRRWKRRSIQR